jgi:hypothetical protein
MFPELGYFMFIVVPNKEVTYFWFIEKSTDISISYFFRVFSDQRSDAFSMEINDIFLLYIVNALTAENSNLFPV